MPTELSAVERRLFAIITAYDKHAGEVLAAMEECLPEAYVDLFEAGFPGIIALIDHGKIESLQRNGGFWRQIPAFELALLAENLDYNIFPLSKKIPQKPFIYIALQYTDNAWTGEGFSVLAEKIVFRRDVKSRAACLDLVRQIYPDFEDELFDDWVLRVFETGGKAWWEV